jgi:signal transduction histidine kinase
MVNRDVDIIRVSSGTNREIGFDAISKTCAQAYEVYFRGKMLCQGSRCDSLGAFQDSEHARGTADREKTQKFSTPFDPIRCGREAVGIPEASTDITQIRWKKEEFAASKAHMAQTEWPGWLRHRYVGLAHDLKQPLTVIRLSLDDALDKLNAASSQLESAAEGLQEALNQVPNLMAIVDTFRDLARDPPAKTLAEVDTRMVAEKIARLFKGSTQRMRIVLRLGETDKLPPVIINEKDLEQLFFIFVENALHAADGEGTRQLIVNGAIRDRYLRLTFSDNCGGIPPENLDKIFEPFFSTKPPDQGMGMGLWTAQRIVSRVGGSVRVESEFGVGSTFFVDLPLSGRETRGLTGAAKDIRQRTYSARRRE